MNSGHRFHVPTPRAFIQAAFHQMGSNDQKARLAADHLIASNLAGRGSHGIGMIPNYIRSFSQGHPWINCHAKVVEDAKAAITLGGDCASGQVVMHEVITLGIEKVRQCGIATVVLHNSHHINHIGYWAEQCAAVGLVSVYFVNVVGISMVAPFHGHNSRFSTNPSCAVFLRKNTFPLLLGYTTSTIASGKTRVAWHKGESAAPGYLIDVAGVPTIDPTVMQVSPPGSLLTFAGRKGYALAAMCEIMSGAFSGGKTTYEESLQTSADTIINCMTTVIMDPQPFSTLDCDNQTAASAEWVRASPHAEDAPILLPREQEANTREERSGHGIPLDAGSWRAIREAALQIGMLDTVLQEFC